VREASDNYSLLLTKSFAPWLRERGAAMAKHWLIAMAATWLVVVLVGLGLVGAYVEFEIPVPQTLQTLLLVSAAVVLLVAILGATVGVARWVLRPLDEAAKRSNSRLQFTLLDFFCLFALVQAPMAVIHGVVRHTPPAAMALMDVFAWFAVGSMWFLGVWAMSRAGVVRARDRCLFLLVVLPVSIISVLEFPGWCIVQHLMSGYSVSFWDMLPLIVVLTGVLAGVYPCGRLMRRIIAETELSPPRDGEREEDLFA
jgi:hypothetical protein